MLKRSFYLVIAILLYLFPCLLSGQNNVPVLEISIKDSLSSVKHDIWKDSVKVSLIEENITLFTSVAQIKGRGHSTWTKRKKPYSIRFNHPVPLLGMRPHKNWALLANVMDHSHMRNLLALEIARQTSLRWTPEGRFVSFVANGRNMGLYYLCENVSTGNSRLNASTLMEFDAYRNDTTGLSPESYRSLSLDTLSLVDWLIVQELTMNAEPNGPRSTYLHITPDGIMHMGPAWDFDLAFNEVGVGDDGNLRPMRMKGKMDNVRWLTADSIYNCRTPLFACLDKLGAHLSYQSLWKKMSERYRELYPKFSSLVSVLNITDSLIGIKAEDDQKMWNEADPARFDPSGSYHSSYERLKSLYLKRLEAMNHWFDRPFPE